MDFSAQQDAALKAIDDWIRDPDPEKQYFYLGGYAGTGKTTIALRAAREARGKVMFAAYTGKAALVLKSKGCSDASTIHSLIYKPFTKKILDKNGNQIGEKTTYELNNKENFPNGHDMTLDDLIVIDECSMVDLPLARDLLSFGSKVLVLGDPAQLPPVGGEGFFTARKPDFMMTEIHRQARDNPIIRLSMDVREGRRFSIGDCGSVRVERRGRLTPEESKEFDQILVGRNVTRISSNTKMRGVLGFESNEPEVGERLICLRNDRKLGLLNGGLWEVEGKPPTRTIPGYNDGMCIDLSVKSIDSAGSNADVVVHEKFFNALPKDVPFDIRIKTQEFTYGYAITVHKSQGSQWNNVLLIDESYCFREDRTKHLYTGITRAADKITILV